MAMDVMLILNSIGAMRNATSRTMLYRYQARGYDASMYIHK